MYGHHCDVMHVKDLTLAVVIRSEMMRYFNADIFSVAVDKRKNLHLRIVH